MKTVQSQNQRSEEQIAEESINQKPYWKEALEDASETERIIIDWLLKADYKAKLTALIIQIWLNDDHGTKGIAWNILNQWTEEVLNNVKNPTDDVSGDELAMSGVVAECEVWLENL